MKIALSSDHAGRHLKMVLAERLTELGHEVSIFGAMDATSVDYPDCAMPALVALVSDEVERCVLVCGTGQGMAMTANRVPGVRAAVVADPFSARMALAHNDARCLCLGERVVGSGVAIECLEAWLDASFEGGRHARRVQKMMQGGSEG